VGINCVGGGAGGGGGTAGPHTHVESDVTGLAETLAGKAPSPHSHPQSDVTNLTTDLAAKAAAVHSHAQADVTGLVSALSGKAATSHTHVEADVTGLTASLAGKASASHTHAQSEITGLVTDLSGKAASVHTHAQSDVTGLVTALSNKSDVGHTHPGGGDPLALSTFNLSQAYPFGGAATTLTATNHAATVARVFPFTLPGAITVNRLLIRTNAVLSNCLQLGIFDSTGTRLWTSGVLSTVATAWLSVSVSALALGPGTYYFASTNNNVVSTTAAYAVTPVIGLSVPRWGTVPATAGAMPASIDPTQITETTGGWMSYVVLSEWTT
jgi:hypothetical protein